MNICLFYSDEIKNPLDIKDERAQHILKVLHKKEGESFFAGIINGEQGMAIITKITQTHIEFDFKAEANSEPLHPLKMIIGFPRPIQLKRLLRDVAALGVQEVHLTGTELGEKSYLKSNLSEHKNAYKMLVEGTVQAANTNVPNLFIYQNLKECLKAVLTSDQLLIALDNINSKISLSNFLKNELKSCTQPPQIVSAIGSERGWTNNERILLENVGFIRCSMGCRVMRTETAVTVAASIISSECGWLN